MASGILLFFLVVFASDQLLRGLRAAGGGEFGALRLCPPGGRSFNMAWRLACEMRKKRTAGGKVEEGKRAVDSSKWRPLTLTEIQNFCCKVGCEVRDLLAYCDPFGSWNS